MQSQHFLSIKDPLRSGGGGHIGKDNMNYYERDSLPFEGVGVGVGVHLPYQSATKRNRNPNWTDGEIIRFLEILSEEEILIDLKANKIKQVSTN